MRFRKLHLKAFGPFTDKTIDFDSRGPALHLVYGPNEAGKSSSLRGLKALLFGFEERPVDNFLHSNPNLLVGGIVEDELGDQIEFYRRKKRLADLVDEDNNPLEEGAIGRLMPGIGKDLFTSLYGIDHRMLVAGGEEILARRGEVGQALFAAGSGIASLSRVLAALDEEASELFKSRGSKQQINRAVAVYQELKKTAREESLLPARYEAHERARKEAQAERLRLVEESRQVSSEIERLSRLNRIIPELAELDRLKLQLEAQATASRLPAGFADRTARIEQEIDTLGPQIEKLKKRCAALRQRTQRMSPDLSVLDQAAAIEDLYQRLGQYRAGGKDRLKLDRDRAAQRRDAGLLIESIDPRLSLEDADALRRTLGRSRFIQRLCSAYQGLDQRQTLAAAQSTKLSRLLEKKNEELAKLAPRKDTGSLAAATERGRSVGNIDAQIDGLAVEIETAEKGCTDELDRLGLWSGGLEDLEKTHFPLRATLLGFDREYRDLERQADRFEVEQKRLAAETEEAKQRLGDLLQGDTLPSESDLLAIREKRQQGWNLIRRSWLEGDESAEEIKKYDPDLSLDSAYEKQVEKADRIADQLREEADRSARADSLNRQLESLRGETAALAEKRTEAERRSAEWQTRWRSVWRELEIEPLTPAEMLGWLDQLDKLRFKLSALSNRKQEYAIKLQSRSSLIQALDEELRTKAVVVAETEQRLAPLLLAAESALAEAEKTNQLRRLLTEELTALENEHSRAAEELEGTEREMGRWRLDWAAALTHLPVTQQISAAEAVDLLKIIDDSVKKLDAARGFSSRIEGIDRDRERFEQDVQQLVEEIALEPGSQDAEQAVLKLYDVLARSREEKQLLSKDLDALEEVSGDLAAAEKRLAELDEQMAGCLVEAGCRDRSELAEALERSKKIDELVKRIEAAESSIATLSEGVELATIRRQAADTDVDELRSLIPSLKGRLDEDLAPRISELGELIGAENRELALMDGRSRAAEAAEKMEQEGARIQRLVERYTTVTLASLVLKREIERYREAHQDPILRIGSKIFADLTLGSFTELLTDIDERGNPVIMGRRSEGPAVGVESMSDGTRDQLYLALRLATLYFRLQSGKSMPFIVDDVLVNFDDARSRAALQALAELAEQNQVILFTHHEKIVDQAETLGSTSEVVIHRLDA